MRFHAAVALAAKYATSVVLNDTEIMDSSTPNLSPTTQMADTNFDGAVCAPPQQICSVALGRRRKMRHSVAIRVGSTLYCGP